MGENNSKPEHPYANHQQTINESHDNVNIGGERVGRYQPKATYSSTNAALHPNEDLIRALIKENRIKNEEIEAERLKKEVEIRTRQEEQKCNERIIREKERQLKEQAELMKKQNEMLKKQQEIAKQAIEREKMAKKTSVEEIYSKFDSDKLFELRETERVLRSKEFRIKKQAEIIKKQNELLENRKCVEKQLLENLVHTELSKLKCNIKQNPKPFTHQYKLNDQPKFGKGKEAISDMRHLRIENKTKNHEHMSGESSKKRNKERNLDGKTNHAEDTKRSNALSDGKKSTPFQSHKTPHVKNNPQKLNSNQSTTVVNDRISLNHDKAQLPAVIQNHFYSPPPPPYSTHSFYILNPPAANYPPILNYPPAVNYPQQVPVYNIPLNSPPPSYQQHNNLKPTPQNNPKKRDNRDGFTKIKTNNDKVNREEQHDKKFQKGNKNYRRDDANDERGNKNNRRGAVNDERAEQPINRNKNKDNMKVVGNFEKLKADNSKNLNNKLENSNKIGDKQITLSTKNN